MKIVYCIAGTYNSGGMERVLANKANYWARQGHEVSIITTEQEGRKPYFPLDERIACYDLAIGYEQNNGKSFFKKLLTYPAKQRKHKQRLTQKLQELKADIVISMFCNDASFITDIADGSKKVLEIHFSKFKRLQYGRSGLLGLADRLRTRLDEGTVRKFQRFVVLTQEDAEYWGNLPNICVIPNARTFPPVQEVSVENKKVIAVGRYSEQKGFDRLIDIWAQVCSQDKEWHLDIIGEGELRTSLQNQIELYGIEDRVTLVPASKQIEEHYREASVLVMTSRYEGLPMILLEGQAFGLPIVSYACKCGPKDVVTDGKDGFLVREGDADTFAQRLLQLMNDAVLRTAMAEHALIASEQYSEEAVMAQWTTLFQDLMKR